MKPLTLKQQVSNILNAKIKRIASACWLKANPNWRNTSKRNAYTLPVEVEELTAMLGKIETATSEELEQMAFNATNGAIPAAIWQYEKAV